MPATIKDIASRTGLGLATISKYLNGGNVRQANRVAIEEAIAALDFTANAFARGLKTNRSKTIGIVIPELSNLFVTTIVAELEDVLRRRGYAMLVCDCRSDSQLEREAVLFLLRKGVDGLINLPISESGENLTPALEKGVPVVLLDRSVRKHGDAVDAVIVDNAVAARNATAHLIEHGHARIGIVVGPRDVYTSRQRLHGYREALDERAVPFVPELARYSDYSLQGGYESVKSLVGGGCAPTALFVTNYEMTLGAIIALNEMDVRFPTGLSIIGFDNMQLARVVRPSLTIVSQPLEQIGQEAARLVLERLEGDRYRPAQVVQLSTQLLMGDSVSTLAI